MPGAVCWTATSRSAGERAHGDAEPLGRSHFAVVGQVITVLGWAGGTPDESALGLVRSAGLVIGGRRHLSAFGVADSSTAQVLGAGGLTLAAALDVIAAAEVAGTDIVVLASGDPGFFGVLRALRQRDLPVRAVPAVSSVATAFARLGLPWDDALVLSAHGRDPGPALAAARTHPKVAVLTASGNAAQFASELVAAGRQVFVAECLGTDAERLAGPDDGPFAEPNVVVALDPSVAPACGPSWRAGPQEVPPGWALPEDVFDHRNGMVTKAEVRAVLLAHLAPRRGMTLWDVGAGSGSVAVECARFGADVLAIERDEQQCRRIERNAAAHAVRVQVVQGSAPPALQQLRPADAVFVGGGGPDVVQAAVELARPNLIAVALAAVERIGPTMQILQRNGFTVDGVQLQASRLRPLPDGSHRLAATNPVTILRGVQP